MDTNYVLVILWFVFFCLTFGCLVGGDIPKTWVTPTKAGAFRAWLIAVFWPVAFVYIMIEWAIESIRGYAK